MRTSQPIFLPSRLPSWRDRKCSSQLTISKQRLPRLHGEANLTDVGSRKRQNHQPRPRTLVCHTSQQPQGRSLRRQPRSLLLQAEGGCSFDRRGCIARLVEELAMARHLKRVGVSACLSAVE